MGPHAGSGGKWSRWAQTGGRLWGRGWRLGLGGRAERPGDGRTRRPARTLCCLRAFLPAPARALSAPHPHPHPEPQGGGPGEWQSVSPPDLDPIEFSDEEELSSTLGSTVSTNCSVQGLPAPALRWTKVRRRGAPSPRAPPSPPLPLSQDPPGLFPPPPTPQDSVPLGDGPTLSLSSLTFDSAGTYVCEAYTPTVPLLSRTRVLTLLVEG